jgi:HrpA-like RNA helicase
MCCLHRIHLIFFICTLSHRAFETALQGSRKVIIATNIAETSVTIEGVKFVVDAGLVKMKYFNVVSGIDALLTCPVAQSSANQRAGRAGRTAPGKCYRLLTEQSFSKLEPFNTPEMQRTDITWAVLQLKALGIDDVIHFDFLSSPYLESLNYSLELLYSLGALDLDCKLTDIGEKMSGVCSYCKCSYCKCSYCMYSYCMYSYCMGLSSHDIHR